MRKRKSHSPVSFFDRIAQSVLAQMEKEPIIALRLEKIHFTVFNYCARSIFNLDVQNQESCNLQVSKPFVFHPSPVSRAVCADVKAVFLFFLSLQI